MTTFRTADGVELAYRTVGAGPLLVCQSGGPGRASRYLRDLGGLARTRTLLLLDSRGTGESGRPDDPARLAAPYVAADLAGLRAHLGVDTFDLLAHSAGAIVAQLYAAAHPATLRRLVLVTPSGRLQGRAGLDVEAIVDDRRGDPALADAVAAYDRGDDGAAARPLLYGTWTDDVAAHAAGADTEMDPEATERFGPPPGLVDGAAVVAALAAVTAPVLVVAGDRDASTGVDAAYAVAESFPDARVEVLAGCGHFPWVEQPEAFAPLVEGFLTGP